MHLQDISEIRDYQSCYHRKLRDCSALMTAISLNVPMIILKKQPSKVLNDNLLQTVVTSFTKGTSYELTLSHQFIEENDNVLIIDDFLANGEAASGAIRLLTEAGASIAVLVF